MALVKLVIEKRNSSGTVTSREPVKIMKSIVRREGSRSVDTAEVTVSAKHDVTENDTIKYIQDVSDTDFLTAIYNFQANDLDEGGNDLDGDGTHTNWKRPQDLSTTGNQKKFAANYAVQFTGTSSDFITVSDNSLFDFSGQFDIFIWTTAYHLGGSDGDKRIIFSKFDNGASGNGIEIGAKKYLGVWCAYAIVRQNGTNTEWSCTGNDYLFGTIPRLLRLKRNGNNEIYFTIHGSYDGVSNPKTVSGDLSNNVDIRIGSNFDDSSPYYGLVHQLRIYNGGFLDDDNADIVMSASPQPMTMKFLGRVWKVDDDIKTKKLFAKGSGRVLLQTNINASLLSSTHTGENATRSDDNNVFDSGQNVGDVLQSIIKRADPDFKYFEGMSGGTAALNGEYIGEGSFVRNVELLTVYDRITFFTLPRKIFIVENDSGVSTAQNGGSTVNDNYYFVHGGSEGYRITNTGYSDVKTTNDIELIGRSLKKNKVTGFGTVNASGGNVIKTISNTPIEFEVVQHTADGNPFDYSQSYSILTQGTDYDINIDKLEITFKNSYNSGSDAVSIVFSYEDIANGNYYRSSSASSITDIQRYSKRIYISQFNNRNDFSTFGTKFLNILDGQNQKITIMAPFLINSLRENHKINVTNSVKFSTDQKEQIVKQIEWRYPEGMTIIQCGEFQFDSFDLEKQSSSDISSAISSITETKNV